jgi:hypothetical protein
VTEDRWVEVWKGDDPSVPGRKLDAAGIQVRIASAGWGAHGGGIGVTLLSLLTRRKSGQARLLVPEQDRERARAALRDPLPPPPPSAR